ncbi:MAG: YceI family protein [Planctomycetota bacterium]
MRGTRGVAAAAGWAMAVAVAGGTAGSAWAEPATYDFADPKGVNGVMFVLDSELEPFVGIGGGIAGEVTYDPADPSSFGGSISLDARTLQLVSQGMTDVMFNADWLNVEDRATITVTFHDVAEVGVAPHDHHEGEHEHQTVLTVNGTITFGAISIDKQFQIEPTFVEDGATNRGAGQGDLLVLRSKFTVNRFDLGIENPAGVVAPEIHVTVPIVGYEKSGE